MSHQKHLRLLAIAAALAMALYLLATFAGDARQIGNALGTVTWLQLALILGLSLFNYALRFMRWQYYVTLFGHQIPWLRHCAYYLVGFAFTVTPGKAGEAVRSLYLKPHGMGYAESLAAFFVERLLDVLAIAALALGGAWLFPDYRTFVLLSCFGLIVFTWLIIQPELPNRLEAWATRLPDLHKLPSFLQRLAKLLRASTQLLTARKLYAGLAVGVFAWAAEGFALYLILRGMNVPLPVGTAIGIYAVSVLAGAISFLPGGLGSTEAVMGLLLVLVGVDSSTAIAATLLCRFTTLWFAVLIGLLALLGLEVESRSNATSVPLPPDR